MKAVLNRLGSIKLTLTVLLLLSCAAAFGTFLPRGGNIEAWQGIAGNAGARMALALGLTDFYHSIWFTSLLAVLVINLLSCMVNRFPGMLSSLSGKTALGREAAFDLPVVKTSADMVAAALKASGFRPKGSSVEGIYSRGSSGYAFTLLAHGSILLIMVFSILGSALGFVATQRVYVGDTTTTAFNWKIRADAPLPFELRAEDFTLLPNPVGVRLGVLKMETGKKGKVITTHEGGTFKVPGIEGRIRLEKFDIEEKNFLASWIRADGTRKEIGRDQEIGDSGISLALIAFATWPERQAVAGITLVYEEGDKRPGEISVNHPMVSDGIRIYLTDYGQDNVGFPYVGFQFVHDPGQTGVWTGCVLFLVCLPGTFFLRHSCAVVVNEGGRLKIYLSSKGNRESVVSQIREELDRASGRNRGDSEA